MATQVKLTIKRGQTSNDVTSGAGDVIAGSDALALNMDLTNMSQREALVLIEELRKYIIDSAFPV